MQELHYDGPATVPDAIALLAKGEARVLAGGTDLIPQMREGRRVARPRGRPEAHPRTDRDRAAAPTVAGASAPPPASASSAATRGSRANTPACSNRPAWSAACRCRAAPASAATSAMPRPRPMPCRCCSASAPSAKSPARTDAARCRSRTSPPAPAAPRCDRANCWSRSSCRRHAAALGGEIPALHAAPRDGHRHRRRRLVPAIGADGTITNALHHPRLGRADAV